MKARIKGFPDSQILSAELLESEPSEPLIGSKVQLSPR